MDVFLGYNYYFYLGRKDVFFMVNKINLKINKIIKPKRCVKVH
jgi:hypothetical protein